MEVDKWFNKQSRLLQVILLIIPFVGWIVELLVRLSAVLRKKDGATVVGLLIFLFLGWSWIICVIDLIYLVVKGHLILT